MNEMELAKQSGEVTAMVGSEQPQKVEVVVAGVQEELEQLQLEGLEKLTPKQQAVIGWLKSGKKPAKAARLAGVARGSIYRWKSKEPLFRTLFNQLAREEDDENRHEMRQMVGQAMGTLRKAMKCGSVKAAEIVLKANEMMKPTEIGSTDLEEVEWDMALEVERKMKRMQDMEMKARLGM